MITGDLKVPFFFFPFASSGNCDLKCYWSLLSEGFCNVWMDDSLFFGEV